MQETDNDIKRRIPKIVLAGEKSIDEIILCNVKYTNINVDNENMKNTSLFFMRERSKNITITGKCAESVEFPGSGISTL
jgi:hypothetical protein